MSSLPLTFRSFPFMPQLTFEFSFLIFVPQTRLQNGNDTTNRASEKKTQRTKRKTRISYLIATSILFFSFVRFVIQFPLLLLFCSRDSALLLTFSLSFPFGTSFFCVLMTLGFEGKLPRTFQVTGTFLSFFKPSTMRSKERWVGKVRDKRDSNATNWILNGTYLIHGRTGKIETHRAAKDSTETVF